MKKQKRPATRKFGVGSVLHCRYALLCDWMETPMPFTLTKGGKNVVAEVQRWQYFLLRQGMVQVGGVDGDFGPNTEIATKFFQVKAGIPATGTVNDRTLQAAASLSYTILDDDYYTKRSGAAFPAKPSKLNSPSDASRTTLFGCFKFIQLPLASRPDKESIVIKGSCDDAVRDWISANIVSVPIPQLKFARGFSGTIRCNAAAAPVIAQVFKQWEADDLLHLIVAYDGCFVPRYKRRQAPDSPAGHGMKKSSDVTQLSNHSLGSAFDINAADNGFGTTPAECGQRGSTRELVASANALGLYWGGHFGDPKDGMHFEVSVLS